MQHINLSKYFQSGLFLKNKTIKEKFEVIILENNFVSSENLDSFDWKILFLSDEHKKHTNQTRFRQSLFDQHKKILYIWNQLPCKNIEFGNLIKNQKLCFINLNCGISSLWRKIWIENNDIEYMSKQGFEICEPFDLVNTFYILNSITKPTYIRINNQEIPANIILWDRKISERGVIQFINWWNKNNPVSIIVGWNFLNTMIETYPKLQAENIKCDILWIVDYKFGEDFNNILQNSNKTIIFVDQEHPNNLIQIPQNLKNKVFFVEPQYSKITTILSEYQFQQSQFDHDWFLKTIKNIIFT